MPSSWYKTKPGIAFLAVLSLLFVGLLWMAGLVAYYAWSISRGDGAAPEKEFSQTAKFSLDRTKNTQSVSGKIIDTRSLILPHTPTKGNKEAAVTIVAFIDFECPYCQETAGTFAEVMNTYEQVAYVAFKHFPLEAIHPNAMSAANAAACAHDQRTFWGYHHLLFQHKVFEPENLYAHIKTLGLNVNRFEQCFEQKIFEKNITRDLQDGAAIGVRGTPTYVVNGKIIEGVLTKEQWDELILNELKK